uniref:isoleucine--tRNA ligase n=1 Tax=Hucho hucho TaxID=62062 RepID=A0A4W5LUE4_9TELE
FIQILPTWILLDFWKKENIFEKSVTTREGNTPFVFFEGPPSANGLPGIHHVMARAIKDIFCRYKTQKGFQVKRKAGWDTHGLPVELGTEKELGITKEDIGKKITVEEYNEACKKTVMRYTDVWNDLTEKMGYWVDMEDPYVTYKSKYMESVWWLLKQIYNKDLMYKGYTIQPYSPKAGTGLSSHEVNQPGSYRDVTDTTVVFERLDLDEIHFLAWTTTPWTLPSNTALTVGPRIEYVLVKTFNQYTFRPSNVILAKNLVGKQFGKGFFEKNAFRVISGDFVTTEDGTGIVHTAPTFGADDAKVAKEATPEVPPMLVLDENDNPVPLVDLQGKFISQMGEFGGKYVKN